MSMAGHSGNPKNSDRVFQVLRILDFEICNSKSARKNRNPKIRVPKNSGSGSGLPDIPELSHCAQHSLHSTHEDMMNNKSTIIMKNNST